MGKVNSKANGHFKRLPGPFAKAILQPILSSLLKCASLVAALQAASAQQPNILFILADDLGYEDIGCYGNTFHETPNIDRLASEGIKLTRHYSAAAVCSPTRASILTGNFPARLRVTEVYDWGFRINLESPLVSYNDDYMDPEWLYMPAAMGQLGYATGLFGKWHLQGVTPAQAGFDTAILTSPTAMGAAFDNNVFNNDEWKSEQITEDTIQFIEESVGNNQPFFAFVSHDLVHVPWGTRSDLLDKYNQKLLDEDDWQGPAYAGMVEQLDDSVGALLTRLDQLGVLNNTLVILTSDNGPVGTADTLLNRGKSFPFEGGIRVPFVAKWPGTIPEGFVRDDVVVSSDYFRTFHAIGGGDPAVLDGDVLDSKNFLPVLLNQTKEERAPIIFHFPLGRDYMGPWSAIMDGPDKFILHWEGWLTPSLARTQEQTNRLYHLETDERELNNLISTQPAVAETLRNHLVTWLTDNQCQFPRVRPPLVPKIGYQSVGGGVLTVALDWYQATAGVIFTIEKSPDLLDWNPDNGDWQQLPDTPTGDGGSCLNFERAGTLPSSIYIRIKATLQ